MRYFVLLVNDFPTVDMKEDYDSARQAHRLRLIIKVSLQIQVDFARNNFGQERELGILCIVLFIAPNHLDC